MVLQFPDSGGKATCKSRRARRTRNGAEAARGMTLKISGLGYKVEMWIVKKVLFLVEEGKATGRKQ